MMSKKRTKDIFENSVQTGISIERFEELFANFYPKLLAYTVSILNDKEVGEDIVQEVFLYAWENRSEIYFGDGVFSYLFQSAYSRSLDFIRKSNRYGEDVRQTLIEMADEYHSLLINDSYVLKELFKKDFIEELDLLLLKLPADRSNVFRLVYFEGLKAKEVAEALKMPQRTVESHIYLTIKFLRKHMKISDFLFLVSAVSIF